MNRYRSLLAMALIIAPIAILAISRPALPSAADQTTKPEAARTEAPERPAPLKLRVVSADKKELSFGQLVDSLMEADIICVGETHDSEPNHRVQLQIIKALFARDERIGVGMEMFQKPFQRIIDDYIAGKITENQFLKYTEYRKRWGFDWRLYRPIVEFCRRNEIPLAALNLRKEFTSRLYKVGCDGLTDAEKNELGSVDLQVKAHREYWYELLPKMHGLQKPTIQQKDRSYLIMTAWDEVMGRNAAEFMKARGLNKQVVLAGIGHIAGGFGIPDRAARYSGGKVVTVRVVVEGSDSSEDDSDLPVDFTIYVQK